MSVFSPGRCIVFWSTGCCSGHDSVFSVVILCSVQRPNAGRKSACCGRGFCFTCAFFDSHVPFIINFVDSIIEYWELMPIITVIIVCNTVSINSVFQSFYIWFLLTPSSCRDGVYSFSRCSMWAQEACDLLQTSGLYGISRGPGSRTLAVEGSIFLPPHYFNLKFSWFLRKVKYLPGRVL